ncbi:MAG TPA: hypothetical protein VM118_01840 [Acidobacteriota bacterium]|nr:hypothetical protein [Acidobacteriota bacterium]
MSGPAPAPTEPQPTGSPGDTHRSRRLLAELRTYAVLAAAHLGLAALFTQPLIFRATTHTALADLSSDQFQTIWSFWWLKRALFELGQNPYWTDAIYYPHGTGLGYHLSPFTGLCAIFVSAVNGASINAPIVYNILLFASFVVTGLGAFALTRHLTGNVFAAFVASIVVTVSPFRLWHLNHLNLLSLGWGLWAIHFAIRWLSRPRFRTMFAAVCFLGITFYSSMTMAAYVVLFLLAYALLTSRIILRSAERGRLWRGALAGIALTAIVCSLGLWELHQTDSDWNVTWQDTVEYSADVQRFVTPAHAKSLVARWLGSTESFGTFLGGEVFLGWLLPAAALIVVVLGRRRVPALWLILAGIFLVLSLGPTLKIGDRRLLDGWLPFRWLFEYVPFLNLSRVPMRFATVAHLCLAVYCAQGLAVWIDHLRRTTRHRRLLTPALSAGALILVAILFVENTRGETSVMHLPTAAVYERVKRDRSITAVYEGPIVRASQICNLYMYFQTIHEKNVANGYLTHPSRNARDLLDQITTGDSLSVGDRRRLADAGIDVMVYHDRTGVGTIIPLR